MLGRIQPRWLLLCMVAVAIAAALFAVLPREQAERVKLFPAAFPWNFEHARQPRAPHIGDAVHSTHVTGQQTVMKRLRTLEEFAAEHPVPDPLAVLEQFEMWATKARAGNTRAMLGIAYTLAGCRSFEDTTVVASDGSTQSRSDRCGAIPPQERVAFQDWLRRAAAAGDVRAMIDFGLNAKALLSRDAARERDPSELAVKDEALAYLNQAAASGFREALLALHEAHKSGWYGPVDNVEAAGHLLALSALAPDAAPPDAVRRFVEGSLSPHERTLAERRAAQIVASLPD